MAYSRDYIAVTKFLFASPSKVKPVADVVRRRSCTEAAAMLEVMPQKGARLIKKTLKSAVSNALNSNKQLDEDVLFIKEIRIDEGPRLKRVWYRGRGKTDRLVKRMCHITVVVEEKAGK